MWRTRPSPSSVSRLRYVDARSERGTRPPTPSASSSTVAGPSAQNSASSTSRRAAETRRPPARSAAIAASSVATARGGWVRAGVIGRPSRAPWQAAREAGSFDLSLRSRVPSGGAVVGGECVRDTDADHSHLQVAGDRRCAPWPLLLSLRQRRTGSSRREPNAIGLQLGSGLRSAGAAAVRADAEQSDLAPGERVAAARLDARREVAERVVVHVADRAAALAHEVVVRMLVRGLVEDAVLAEVGAQRQAGLDQDVERPVD